MREWSAKLVGSRASAVAIAIVQPLCLSRSTSNVAPIRRVPSGISVNPLGVARQRDLTRRGCQQGEFGTGSQQFGVAVSPGRHSTACAYREWLVVLAAASEVPNGAAAKSSERN